MECYKYGKQCTCFVFNNLYSVLHRKHLFYFWNTTNNFAIIWNSVGISRNAKVAEYIFLFFFNLVYISSLQSLSHVLVFVIPWTAAHQASLSITNSWSLLILMSVESRIPSIHLILCCSLLLLPSIFPRIRVFFKGVSSSHQVAKLWSFSCSIRPYSEYSGLISFRIDWFVLLAVQGTLKGLLQHYGSKASFLWCSAFLMVQLSHPHVTTGNTIVLTIWTFVSKVVSLLFNVLSSFVIAFLPRSVF